MTDNKLEFSHDRAFKDLVLTFPKQSLRALVPRLESEYGCLEEVVQLRQEMPRHMMHDPGRIVDLAMHLKFRGGGGLICLMEHQSKKSSFSIHRLCHYVLDLDRMVGGLPVLPVVVFTDRPRWRRDVPRQIRHEALEETWLDFTFLRVKLRDQAVDEIWGSDNPVWYVLAPLLDYPEEERLHVTALAYTHLYRVTDHGTFLRFMDFIDVNARLSDEEKRRVMILFEETEDQMSMTVREMLMEKGEQRGIEIGEQRGIEIGLEKGEQRGIEIGLEKGEQRVRTEMVKSMLRAGLDKAQVSEIAEMTVSEVVEIASEM
ncbi:hypothetical protein SCOR_33255 [Sulfidibacter corallicola]|uniref:Transposase (putative) YhgA-like domain-containing protein n=1 Tax=Sulfidibacter corallicola TaxID=2818388 RepID=A0A8A4TSR6_SULCO|nr:hypothetical protein [Sulfidibacter corallicola]QTD49595.1 hypothetical protein J3U87_28745 [Sulfidibacter corallicola]